MRLNHLSPLTDVVLVHLKADSLSSVSIPIKTYAYLACGKPGLMALDGSIATLMDIESTGAGVTCPPESPIRMAEDIRALRQR